MNNKEGRNSKETIIQLERAEFQKNLLIKNIYKEYEIYFQIVRKCILTSVEKGIFGLFSGLSTSHKTLNSTEINNFLNNNISFLIHSRLPLITIEQLNLVDISDPQKKILNMNASKELVEIKESQVVSFDYEDKLINNEPLEFHCNNNLNNYAYYDSLIEDELFSINLDNSVYLNSFYKKDNVNKFEYEKNIVDYVLELIEETNDNKLNDYENINDQVNDVFISRDNLNFFEIIDKSFNYFLFQLSYKINLELFKINLINEILSEDTFKCLSNNNYIVKHPYPFIIKYDLNLNKLTDNNKNSDIFLFNITNIELEFYNLELSICRNNINELKNNFRLLNKKQRYWRNKELTSNNFT